MKNILRIVVAVLTVVLMTQVAMAEEIYSPGQPGEVLYPADLFHPITVALFSGAEAGKKASRGNQNLADVAIREFSKAKWLAGNYNVGIKKLGKDRVKLLFVKGFAYGVLGEIPVHPGGRTESNNGVQGKTSAATNTAFLGWSGGDGYLEHYLQVTNSPLTANSSMASANSQITAAKLPQLLAKSVFYGAYSPKYRGLQPETSILAEEHFLVRLAGEYPDLFALYISLVDQMPPYSKQAEDRMYENDHPRFRARVDWINAIVGSYAVGNESWNGNHSLIRDYIRILGEEESGAPLCTHKDYSGVKKGFDRDKDLLFGYFRHIGPHWARPKDLEGAAITAFDEKYGKARVHFWVFYADLPVGWKDKNDSRMDSFMQCIAYHESDIVPTIFANLKGYASDKGSIGVSYYNVDNYAEAARWFRMGAEGGDVSSQRNLATLYIKGEGIPRDLAEAERWLNKVKENRDTTEGWNATANLKKLLADAYRADESDPVDLTKAEQLYSDAAEHGHEPSIAALNELGMLYHKGETVDPNYIKAAELFRKAAERGNVLACYNLGVYYMNGWGWLTKDPVEARKWLSKAADQGYDEAKKTLETLK